HNAPAGHYSIQAEITCRKDSAEWRWSDQEILDHTIEGLCKRGLLADRSSVMLTDVRRTDYSYVVYDTAYERNAMLVREWFNAQGIILIGRFSYFEYINVDQAVARALEIAARMNGEPLETGRPRTLARALARLGLAPEAATQI